MGPTTDIIGALDTVNSLYEEPFFLGRQGGGSPPPAATGSSSPVRAVSEQHLHAVFVAPVDGQVFLFHRGLSNRFGRFPNNAAPRRFQMVCCPAGAVCHTQGDLDRSSRQLIKGRQPRQRYSLSGGAIGIAQYRFCLFNPTAAETGKYVDDFRRLHAHQRGSCPSHYKLAVRTDRRLQLF